LKIIITAPSFNFNINTISKSANQDLQTACRAWLGASGLPAVNFADS